MKGNNSDIAVPDSDEIAFSNSLWFFLFLLVSKALWDVTVSATHLNEDVYKGQIR